MMKYAAFDLEIAKDIPQNGNWRDVAPLGITCAAVAFSDNSPPMFWQGIPQMRQAECQQLVHGLQDIIHSGYKLVSWNGCSFDFAVLGEESGLLSECGEISLHHIDLMMIVTFTKGWYLSLESALVGAGLEGKRKKVQLSNGTIIDDMSGIKAPQLWRDGEQEAVLEYLRGDVTELIELIRIISKTEKVQWASRQGKPTSVAVPNFKTVTECFDIPAPDTSWMTNPPTRMQFVDWIPPEILKKYRIGRHTGL